MKRSLRIVLLCLALLLLVSGCENEATVYTEKENYEIGEQIVIRDCETHRVVGEVTVTGAYLVREEPFTLRREVGYNTDLKEIYDDVQYEAIVQITYTATTASGTDTVDEENFTVTDADGEPAVTNPRIEHPLVETSDQSFTVAVEEVGDHVDLEFRFHKDEEAITYMEAEYTPIPENQAGRFGNELSQTAKMWIIFAMISVAVIAAVIVIVLLRTARSKKKCAATICETVPAQESSAEAPERTAEPEVTRSSPTE